MDRLDILEERVAHLIANIEDLSDVVARLAKETDILTRRLQMLMEREAQREAFGETGGAEVPEANVKPPHW